MANINHVGIPPAGYPVKAKSRAAGDARRPRPSHSDEPSLGASWAEMTALIALLIFYLLVPVGATPDALEMLGAANMLGAVTFSIIMLTGAIGMARSTSILVFTAPFWFRISTAIYFGFGNLILFIANDTTIAYVQQFAYLEPALLLKLNTVIVFGTIFTFASTMALQRLMQARFTQGRASPTPGDLGSVAISVAVLGFSAKWLFLIPYQLGAFPGLQLPGAISTVDFLPAVSIFLLVLWALRRGKVMILIPIMLFLLETVGGLVLGNKSVIMIAAVMFALGALCDRVTAGRMLISTALIVVLFNVIAPPVDAVRSEMLTRYGSISGGTIAERLGVLASYAGDGERASNKEEAQYSLLRLSYATPAGFAISQYDIGLPGDSFEHWLAVFVPRFLWPEKPNITDTGIKFNIAATGSASSQSSPGLFAEAYWNFGWGGVAISMSLLGVALFFLGRYSLWVMQSANWWLLPVALMAMRTGMRVDGFFVADILGGAVIIAALHVIIIHCLRLWRYVMALRGGR